jgi:hypothetical protein
MELGDPRFGSDPLVTRRGLGLGVSLHADHHHFVPAPSTETRATTGATLADHRTTVATVDDFFIAIPP